MLVKQRNQFEAQQWDGVATDLNGCAVGPGPGGTRISDRDSSHPITSGDWVVFSPSGRVIHVLSEADFADQFEEGAAVDASWVATAKASQSIIT